MTIHAEIQPHVIILQGTDERVEIQVTDDSQAPIDATTLSLTVLRLDNSVVWTETYGVGTRIVRQSAGRYYVNWGDPAVANNTETTTTGQYMFRWTMTVAASEQGRRRHAVQSVRVISLATYALVQQLRLIIDKSVKLVDEDPNDPCFLGYTEDNLVRYLDGGLQAINSYQPYPGWDSIETFPVQQYGSLLIEAALMYGVMSQMLFAVDTDIENWNDQGNGFTIAHQPKLAAFLQQLATSLDQRIPKFKMHFLSNGSVRTVIGPSFRLNTLISASPSGALFRGLFFRS